jgi:hypothetical protein
MSNGFSGMFLRNRRNGPDEQVIRPPATSTRSPGSLATRPSLAARRGRLPTNASLGGGGALQETPRTSRPAVEAGPAQEAGIKNEGATCYLNTVPNPSLGPAAAPAAARRATRPQPMPGCRGARMHEA